MKSMVYKLAYKDIVVHRTLILTYLAVLLGLALQVIEIDPPAAVVTLMATMFVFSTAAQDDRSNAHILINSLPVSRKEVVTARYAVSLGVAVAFVGLTALVVVLIGRLPLRVVLGQWAIAAVLLPLYAAVTAVLAVFLLSSWRLSLMLYQRRDL